MKRVCFRVKRVQNFVETDTRFDLLTCALPFSCRVYCSHRLKLFTNKGVLRQAHFELLRFDNSTSINQNIDGFYRFLVSLTPRNSGSKEEGTGEGTHQVVSCISWWWLALLHRKGGVGADGTGPNKRVRACTGMHGMVWHCSRGPVSNVVTCQRNAEVSNAAFAWGLHGCFSRRDFSWRGRARTRACGVRTRPCRG